MIEIDLGNTRGVKRPLDNLGRVVIPKEFREELQIKEHDELQVYLLENGVYVTKK
jgi:transcriptional pleiotropic regulator of transition state genes